MEALVEVDIVDLIAGIEARDESNTTGELCSKGGFRLDGQTEESGLSKHGFRRMLDDWGRKCHTQAGSHYREGRECGGPKGRCRLPVKRGAGDGLAKGPVLPNVTPSKMQCGSLSISLVAAAVSLVPSEGERSRLLCN